MTVPLRSRTNRGLVGAVVALTCIVVGQFVWQEFQPEPRVGLDYPVQRVLNRVDGVSRPTLHIGDVLRVQGTKCNVSGAPVPLSGVTSWVSVDPPGSIYETSRGSTVRPPGCATRTFENPVPAVVVDRTRAVIAGGELSCVTWTVTGRETPTDPMVLPVVWTTEPFDLCG